MQIAKWCSVDSTAPLFIMISITIRRTFTDAMTKTINDHWIRASPACIFVDVLMLEDIYYR